MAFYTRWLIVPAIAGFIVFCMQVDAGRLDVWPCIPYSVGIMIWSCFMLAFWRQKSSALAYRWGVLDYEVGNGGLTTFLVKQTNRNL
jgi:Calcium-activated chloride channel